MLVLVNGGQRTSHFSESRIDDKWLNKDVINREGLGGTGLGTCPSGRFVPFAVITLRR